MNTYEIIAKKRDGLSLTKNEIDFVIKGYTKGHIPDYQVSALLMAIFIRGLSKQEVSDLTMSMIESGERLDLSGIKGIKVDKHSTGGVGDKTTLVLGPVIAAAGIPFAKMAGRGLGHTGGTVDKLESIAGFNAELSTNTFIENINKYGLAVASQSSSLTPADKMLYALRDVTATVESIPLIASSIMCKKIASGADAILLDVKTGSGAFMSDMDRATALAELMVGIGETAGKNTIALITNMQQPLGKMVGNIIEVKESIEVLNGGGPEDLRKLCIILASYMLLIAKCEHSLEKARYKVEDILIKGKGIMKFKEMVEAQGGDKSLIDNPEKMPAAKHRKPVLSSEKGIVLNINAKEVGMCALLLGAGRKTIEDTIDYCAGIELNKKIGDSVSAGEALAYMHTNSLESVSQVEGKLENCFEIGSKPVQNYKLVHGIMDKNGYNPFAGC